MTYIGSYDTEKIPRGINIDPRGNFVIVAGQESGYVSVHAINQETGELEPLNRYESGKDPTGLKLLNLIKNIKNAQIILLYKYMVITYYDMKSSRYRSFSSLSLLIPFAGAFWT